MESVQKEIEEFTYKGKNYLAVKDDDNEDNYELYGENDKKLLNVIGTIKMKDGKFLGSTFKLF